MPCHCALICAECARAAQQNDRAPPAQVGKAASEHQGERLTLHLSSADGSRAMSMGIQSRSKLVKLMDRYTKTMFGGGSPELLFEWKGRQLGPADVVDQVGLVDGATIRVTVV